MISKNIEQMKVEISNHIAADAVIQWENFDGEKGSFIGCLTHSDDAQGVVDKYGLPILLVKICESIHDWLPEGEYLDFFSKIGDAIEVDGKDLSKVHWLFLKEILQNLPVKNSKVQKVIDPVIEGMDFLSKGIEWPGGFAAYVAGTAYADDGYAPGDFLRINVDVDAVHYSCAISAACVAESYYGCGAESYCACEEVVDCTTAAATDDRACIKQKEIMLRLLKEAPMAVAP